jgi:hypothetical protein
MEKAYKRQKTNRNSFDTPLTKTKEKQASLPNSLVMRIMQQPDAEDEADRLSKGVTSSSPDTVRREMGDRLGADFSQVQFHTDANSVRRSQSMGARAWTQGRDGTIV